MGCLIVEECLEENLYERAGVFGGTSERECRRIRVGRSALRRLEADDIA